MAAKTGDKRLTGFSYHALGALDYYNGRYTEAIEKFIKAMKFYQEVGDKKLIAQIMRNFSGIYYLQGNYSEAMKYDYKILKYFEEKKDTAMMIERYQSISGCNYEQGNIDEALKITLNCLQLRKEINDSIGIAQSYNSIGEMYLLRPDFANALPNYFAALKIYQQPDAPAWGMPWCYSGIGRVLELRGDSLIKEGDKVNGFKKYIEAKNYYIKSQELAKKVVGNDEGIAEKTIFLGDIYVKLNDLTLAKKYLQEALEFSKKIASKKYIRDSYLSVSKLNYQLENYKLAYEQYKLHITYRDSIVNEETIRKTEGYKMQYEFDKKEDQIQLLSTEGKLQTVLAAKQKQQKNIAYGGIATVLLLGGYGFYRYHRRRKLQSQQELMNERLRISRELHDEVGATLSGIAMYSHLTKEQIKNEDTTEVKKSLDIMQQSAGEMVNKLNDIVWLINPEQDSLQKLIERLEEYARDMASIKNMEVAVHIPENIAAINLPIESRRNIYMFCKEAINNAVKYSNATLLELIIKETNGKMEFSVSDNGKGFDAVMVRRGNGLVNMQQRADEIGAKLLIQSQHDGGSQISLQCKIT